jgi:SnoaL-like domain
MATVEDLMHRNLLGVFNERDTARRQEAIAAVYSEDVLFQDPEGLVRGRDAIDAKVSALLDGAPDFAFRPAGLVRVSGDLGMLSWAFGPPGGAAIVSGSDIALVEDGRIVRLHTLLDQ